LTGDEQLAGDNPPEEITPVESDAESLSHADYFSDSRPPAPRRRRPLLVAAVMLLSALAFWQCRGPSEAAVAVEPMPSSESERP